MPELLVQRRAAADRPGHLASQRRAQPRVNQPTEHRVPQPQQRARPESFPAVGDRGGLGGGEQPPVALDVGLLAGGGGDLLEHAGHREQDRGTEGGEFRG